MSGPFCERCGCAFEWQSGELTGPYCTCRPPIQTYATDTTMTTTTPTAPHDSPPYRISERQPVFPCWLWDKEDECYRHFKDYKAAAYDEFRGANYTHWHPDQPTAPTTRPTEEQPAPQPSETPLTDAIAHAGYDDVTYIAKMTEHARALERQLAAAEREAQVEANDAEAAKGLWEEADRCNRGLREELAAVTKERDEAARSLSEWMETAQRRAEKLTEAVRERDEARAERDEQAKQWHLMRGWKHAAEEERDQLRARVAELEGALGEISSMAQNHIPFYAYGDSEAACELAIQLGKISEAVRAALTTRTLGNGEEGK